MKYNTLQLIDFVRNDHFELKAYLAYLFLKFDNSGYNELKKHKQQKGQKS
jgi:hypothetical protein